MRLVARCVVGITDNGSESIYDDTMALRGQLERLYPDVEWILIPGATGVAVLPPRVDGLTADEAQAAGANDA